MVKERKKMGDGGEKLKKESNVYVCVYAVKMMVNWLSKHKSLTHNSLVITMSITDGAMITGYPVMRADTRAHTGENASPKFAPTPVFST